MKPDSFFLAMMYLLAICSFCFCQDNYQGQDVEGYELRKALGMGVLRLPEKQFPAPDGWSWEQREREYGFRVIGLERNRFYMVIFSEVPPADLDPKSRLSGPGLYSSNMLKGLWNDQIGLTSDEIHRWLAKMANDFRDENLRLTAIVFDNPSYNASKRPFPTKGIVIAFERK